MFYLTMISGCSILGLIGIYVNIRFIERLEVITKEIEEVKKNIPKAFAIFLYKNEIDLFKTFVEETYNNKDVHPHIKKALNDVVNNFES